MQYFSAWRPEWPDAAPVSASSPVLLLYYCLLSLKKVLTFVHPRLRTWGPDPNIRLSALHSIACPCAGWHVASLTNSRCASSYVSIKGGIVNFVISRALAGPKGPLKLSASSGADVTLVSPGLRPGLFVRLPFVNVNT